MEIKENNMDFGFGTVNLLNRRISTLLQNSYW